MKHVIPSPSDSRDGRSSHPPVDRTTQLQAWIDLLNSGDNTARERLIEAAAARLRTLAHGMLSGDRLRLWEETDDVLQDALVQLHKSLADVRPETVRDFLRLAAFHIRRALLNMARRYFGPQGIAANQAARGPRPSRADFSWTDHPAHDSTPSALVGRAEQWLRVQEAVGRLPDDEREVTELLWFHGLAQGEAAGVLDISERTVRRRWQRARLQLSDALAEDTAKDI